MLRRFVVLVLCLGVLSSAGCAANRATANASPDAEMGRAKSFYVVTRAEDARGVDALIGDALAKRGYVVKVGEPLPKAPAGTDAIVTYNDRWFWDITMYMVELTITVRNPDNNFPMATGNSYHTSLTRLTPQEMVDEVLTNIFNAVQTIKGTK